MAFSIAHANPLTSEAVVNRDNQYVSINMSPQHCVERVCLDSSSLYVTEILRDT